MARASNTATTLDALADRYLDLWERQADAFGRDPGLAAALNAWLTQPASTNEEPRDRASDSDDRRRRE